MADMPPPPPPPPQLGESFASQYYGLLCSEAHNMHYFYTENSTMILVIDDQIVTTATNLNQIHNLIMSLKFHSIQTNTVQFLECWGRGVLLVVSGFVKIEDVAEFCKFVHTIYLAPQGIGNGYFIKNDILHIVTHDYQVPHELNPVAPITSKDIDPRFYSEHPPTFVTKEDNLDEKLKLEKDIRLGGRYALQIEGRDLREDLKLLMSLTLKSDIQLRGCSDLQIQPIVSETQTAQEEASSSNSSGVANADENTNGLEIEEPVAVKEEPSQSDTPTTPTSTGRGRGNNTRERDSDGRDNGKKKAEN